MQSSLPDRLTRRSEFVARTQFGVDQHALSEALEVRTVRREKAWEGARSANGVRHRESPWCAVPEGRAFGSLLRRRHIRWR